MKTLIRNARIIDHGRCFDADVLLEGEFISRIEPSDSAQRLEATGCEVVEAAGKYLLPGVIDDQVHFRQPGLTHKADIRSESTAAIFGGVTSFMDMPNTKPTTTTLDALRDKIDIAGQDARANYSFYLGATNDNFEALMKADPRHVCGIKVFMGSSTGNMLVDNPDALREIFSQRQFLVATHCEEESLIKANLAEYMSMYGVNIPFECHPLIRSAQACYLSSLKAATLAGKYGARLHILHLSTEKELSLLSNDTELEQKQITGEVCVHHLWFTDSDYKRLGARIKWNPAVKSLQDREALRMAVRDKRLDVIATDHAPHTLQEKSQPYTKAPSGGPLIQYSLLMMLELVRQDVFSLADVVEMMCHRPARLFRIAKRGYVREGYYADLVLIDPDAQTKVESSSIKSKCGWSPLEGETFHNSISKVWLNGTLAVDKGVLNPEVHGKALFFER